MPVCLYSTDIYLQRLSKMFVLLVRKGAKTKIETQIGYRLHLSI